jgi:hypothetical protein
MLEKEDELEPILKTLLNKTIQYESELKELNGKAASVAAKLAQIQAAVSALQGNSVAKPNPLKARAPKRTVPTRAQIDSTDCRASD